MEQINDKGALCQQKLIICRGIQGSGKSTWAKQWCREDPEHRVRFNNDDIRNMLGEYWVLDRENVVSAMYNTTLAYTMAKGYSIVVDNMNLNPRTCEELEKKVKDFNENFTYDWKYEVEYKDFFIPLEECIRRDAMRPNPIGEDVIRQTWKRYKNFIVHEEIMKMKNRMIKYDKTLPPAIIVDMDATLCLNTSGRPFYGEGAAEGMLTDEPIYPILELVRSYCNETDATLIILTGREDTPEIREATKNWLDTNWLHPTFILMRPKNSFVSGPKCKQKLYEDNIKGKYNVTFVLEDNTKCVEMWREQGLICLQPNEGKF